jgi:hypothetical protein
MIDIATAIYPKVLITNGLITVLNNMLMGMCRLILLKVFETSLKEEFVALIAI